MGKGFFEKFKLTESIDEGISEGNIEEILRQQTQELGGVGTTLDVNINVENVTSAEEIYGENELLDKTKSIFKAEEIKNVLPANLPNDAKKASVIGMLSVAQLTVDEILLDADKRIEVLNSALTKFTNETIETVESSEADIVQLEEQINVLREKINSRKKSQEDQETVINDEITKITNIVNFIK